MNRSGFDCDFLIVGSGASGATAAVVLAEAGHSVIVVEEGSRYGKADFREDLFSTTQNLFRGQGMQVARGRSVMPVLEGRCVGGSTVLNGAIVHRFPEAVYRKWSQDIPRLNQEIPWSAIERAGDRIERDLNIGANLGEILPTLPISRSLDRLGWEHQAMLRNAPGCRASGRCLQGCPTGGKWSMEVSYLPRAERAGARILSETRVERIVFDKRRAIGIRGKDLEGRPVRLLARKGVIVAAGVIQSPLLLRRSAIGLAAAGRNFQVHLGIGIVGEMERPKEQIEGPPQGIEITAFRASGFKLATQLVPMELVLSRTPLAGLRLAKELARSHLYSSWMGSIESQAKGHVKSSWAGGPSITLDPLPSDLARTREALYRLTELLFEMGARRVYPGVSSKEGGMVFESMDEAKQLRDLPDDPRYYWLSAGHLFGTCRLGSSANDSVVGTDFRVHGTDGCYVIDASLFPSTLGVNPQHSIMALAHVAAESIATEAAGN